eukprot:CAMPEP_0206043366 /NCGR_PEP_ID=MMETSP1466-20131121/8608_1 /ASSEMBLY_ACC=CAM_ASM_001126 /TAXON_ID=44452 /ORGANISM="Pavlova gyrans, Strain CCMP608" /LENGTH=1075 /DNA_ID=CAMNT_0053418169 /DNA_START=32 /DNA_END=3255 /DNA_ORIENTATION=+
MDHAPPRSDEYEIKATVESTQGMQPTKGEEGAVHHHPIKVGRLTRSVVANPCKYAVCMFFLVILLTVAGLAAIISSSSSALDAIGFGTYEVQGDSITLQSNAFNRMRTFAYPRDASDVEEEEDEDREVLARTEFKDTITFVYEALRDGEQMLTPENVAKMAKVEGALLDTPRWSEFCLLVWNKKEDKSRCASPTSVLNYLYVSKQAHKEQCKDGFCLMPKSGLSACGTLINWGTGLCRSRVYSWRDGELADEKDWGKLVNSMCKESDFTKNYVLDAEADCKAPSSVHTRARYVLGSPLDGYKNADDRADEQDIAGGSTEPASRYGNEFRRALAGPIAEVSATDTTARTYVMEPQGDRDVNALYFSFTSGRIIDTLLLDTYFAIASLIFVFFYMWINTGSLTLTFAGIFEIIASLPLALFFWRVVLQQQKVEILMFLTLYLILCIGSDDVFVFVDSWKESASQPPHISGSLETRLAWTYKQAVSAMFTTTATTVLSLITTASSTIPAISTFGIFAALVVLFDYLLVITWFPAMVIVYTRYIEPRCHNVCACLPCCKISPPGPEGASADGPGPAVEERKIIVFLRGKVAPTLFKFRFAFIGLSLVAVVAMACTLGALFQVAEELPDFFVPEHPQTAIFSIQDDEFFVPDDWKYQVSVVYGLDVEEPITYESTGQITPVEDRESKLQYNETFKLSSSLQKALVDDCKDARDNEDLVQDREVYCLLNDLKDWAGDKFPYDSVEDLRNDLEKFYESNAYRNLTRDFDDYASKTGFVPDGDKRIKAYWVSYNTSIPPETNSGPNVLRPYFERWEAYAETCAFPCFHMTSGGEGQANWVLFRIFTRLFEEVGLAVVFSLVLAFGVLLLTTRNWWVSLFVVGTIACTVICVLASVVARGFTIGIQECIYIVLTIGLSIDYAVHLSHFYVHASGTRYERAEEAVSKILISVMGGATTTAVAAIPLFVCVQTFLYLYGFFILFTSLWAFALSTMLLVPMLMAFGPEGQQGTFSWFARFCGSNKICQDSDTEPPAQGNPQAMRAQDSDAAPPFYEQRAGPAADELPPTVPPTPARSDTDGDAADDT